MKLNHEVIAASWDDDMGVWEVTIKDPSGATFVDRAEILINNAGVLK